MKKSLLILLIVLMAAAPAMAAPYRVSVSQFVTHPALDAVLKGFQDYMAENAVEIDYAVHNAAGSQPTASQIGTQIMGEKPDMVLAIATPSALTCAQALKKAPHMQKTPFLFSAVTDPVSAGLVKSLEKPGANITGVSDMLPVDRHFQMVKEFLPDMKRMGFLYNAGEPNSKVLVPLFQAEAKKMGVELVEATAAKSSDVYQATQSLVGKVDAIFIPTDNTVVSALESAVKVCEANNLPLFNADTASVERGAIAAMGFDYYQHGRQTGALAHRIMKGQDPAVTPVETQEKMQLHLNTSAAAKMGVAVPAALLEKADKKY